MSRKFHPWRGTVQVSNLIILLHYFNYVYNCDNLLLYTYPWSQLTALFEQGITRLFFIIIGLILLVTTKC